MIVGSLRVRLLLREARSLKDKRQVVQSIKDRIRAQFNVSVAEVEDLENRQLAALGFAMVGNEAHYVRTTLTQIVEALRRHPVAELIEHELEVEPANFMKQHRVARVAEVIREVASETILFELKDPRVRNVTVTRAEVAADLQHAKVYVSVMGTPKEQELCMHGLRNSAGFVQAKLGSRMKTRFTPVVTFVLDQGVKNSIEISRLISEALGQGAVGTSQALMDEPGVEEDSQSD